MRSNFCLQDILTSRVRNEYLDRSNPTVTKCENLRDMGTFNLIILSSEERWMVQLYLLLRFKYSALFWLSDSQQGTEFLEAIWNAHNTSSQTNAWKSPSQYGAIQSLTNSTIFVPWIYFLEASATEKGLPGGSENTYSTGASNGCLFM
jgi:hypothetical protein